MSTNKDFIPLKGGYEDSPVYKIARCIYSVTYHFTETYLRRGDRTIDQMVQSARSTKQNIVEGSVDGATSHEMEIKLLNTARGSAHELMADYVDYLTTRGLEQWGVDDPRTEKTRRYCRTHNDPKEYQEACKQRSDETIANIALTLLHQYDVLLVRLIEASKQRFLEQGGIKEEMFRARKEYRSKQSAQSTQSTQSPQSSPDDPSSPSTPSALIILLLLLVMTACSSDWRDGIAPSTGTGGTGGDAAVTFSTVVSASRQATRASKTIINRGEKKLRPTTSDNEMQVGIYGCYTGQYQWEALNRLKNATAYSSELSEFSELSALSESTNPKFSEKKAQILNAYYSANQMYNVPATVEADGSLTYTPQQFWPNNPLTSDATQHEYMTFWAYYPYNTTSTMGEYGISITDETTRLGMGMGKVKFTMNPDASQHNDFLISAPVMDCNRDKYALERTSKDPTYDPKPVQFTLYHMLAQVRMYAYIVGKDKMVYQDDVATQAMLDTWDVTAFTDPHLDTEATKMYFRKADGLTSVVPEGGWLQEGDVVNNVIITEDNIATYADLKPAVQDEYGTWIELKVGDKIPDESQCVRWERKDVWDLNHTRRRADITYSMEFNNIHTTAEFYPRYYGGGVVGISYDPPTTLGSTTVNHYIMNPYWFTFKDGKRERLNDNYMFDYFEDTPVAKHLNATKTMTGYDDVDGWNWTDYDGYDDVDGWDWTGTSDPLAYLRGKSDSELSELSENSESSKPSKHYNFAPGNIILVVPQTLSDDDVPHVVITAKDNTDPTKTARVTINLLKMGISWESGYIYCYAFLDDLRPGDDKVRGPESITVHFNTNWYTDQW